MGGVLVGPPRMTTYLSARQKRRSGLGPVQDRAEAIWLADNYNEALHGPWLKDLSGNGHHMKIGSVAAAWVLDCTLVLPGTGSNNATTPDAASLDITGDIEVVSHAALDDWTPAANSALVAKYQAAGQRSWQFRVDGGGLGNLRFAFSLDGTAVVSAISTAIPVVADGDDIWVKVTRASVSGDVKFYTSPTGLDGSWLQLGATVTVAAGALFSGTSILELGTVENGSPMAGRIFRTIVKNGIDGTTVFDANFTTLTDGTTSFVETTGKTVTINQTAHADTNDPKFLGYTMTPGLATSKGLYLPGVIGNYASVPDEAALDITGDITIDCEVAMEDWTPGATSSLIAKRPTGQLSYQLRLTATGTLELVWWTLGVSSTVVSTVPVPSSDNQRLWVRATLDVNNGAVGHTVKFFTSSDGATWTPLGATVTNAGVTGIDSTNSALEIGSTTTGTAQMATGRFFRARIWNAYTTTGANPPGGNLVLDVDFADTTVVEPYETFVCDTGQTVTITRSASGRKAAIVDRPMFLFGTDDFMECADHAALDFAAADPFSLSVAARIQVLAATGTLIAKRTSSVVAVGYLMQSTTTLFPSTRYGDGAVDEVATGPVATAGMASTITGVRSVANDRANTYTDGVAGADSPDDTTATLANTDVLRIGRLSGGGVNYIDYCFIGAGVWREALTAADVLLLDSEFGTDS